MMVLSGKKNGTAALISSQYPLALYLLTSFELMPKEIYSKSIISVKEARVDNMNFMLKEEQQRVKEQKEL